MPIIRYYNINSNIADMGFFTANISQIDDQFFRAFHGHVQPILFIYGFFANLFSDLQLPYALLIIQSSFFLITLLLLYRFYGFISAFAFSLFPPTWTLYLLDFHTDSVVPLLLVIFFILIYKDKIFYAVLFAIILCFIKEQYALTCTFCGVYLLLNSKPKFINFKVFTSGLFLILYGLISFIFYLFYVLPFFSYDNFSVFSDKQISNLSFFNFHLNDLISVYTFNINKLYYFILLFGFLLFIPLFAPYYLVVAIPNFVIVLITSNTNHIDLYNHYSAAIIIPLILSFHFGINKVAIIFNLNKLFIKNFIFFYLLVINVFFSISPISRFFLSSKISYYNYKSYFISHRQYEIKKLLSEYIPINKDINISSSNSINWYLISTRSTINVFPVGVIEPVVISSHDNYTYSNFLSFIRNPRNKTFLYQYHYADFVIINKNGPFYFGDKGCDWVYNSCLNEKVFNLYSAALDFTYKNFNILAENDFIIIFKRR
jgi:uncharacterized membrane protein